MSFTKASKGFTLVELVIVIAVIAVLAAVSVAVAQNVIRAAETSAENQEMRADELEQKANDILQKVSRPEWYGWDDIERSLAVFYVDNESETDAIILIIKEHASKISENNTAISEELLLKIIKNSLDGKYRLANETQKEFIVENVVEKYGISTSSAELIKVKLFSDDYSLAAAAFAAREMALSLDAAGMKKSYGEKETTALIKNAQEKILSSSGDDVKICGAEIFASSKLTLNEDVALTGEITIGEDSETEVDLNGHTLYLPADGGISVEGKLYIHGDGEIKIKSFGFCITGELVVDGGNFSLYSANGAESTALISVDGGKITINGGSFHSFEKIIGRNGNNAADGEIVISGGRFESDSTEYVGGKIMYKPIFDCELFVDGGEFLFCKESDLGGEDFSIYAVFPAILSCEEVTFSDGPELLLDIYENEDMVRKDENSGKWWIVIE